MVDEEISPGYLSAAGVNTGPLNHPTHLESFSRGKRTDGLTPPWILLTERHRETLGNAVIKKQY